MSMEKGPEKVPHQETLAERLRGQGISRRAFLKFCAGMATLMALPPGMAQVMADKLAGSRRVSVLWYSFQECTGCVESFTRAHTNSIESLIFDFISLDYQHTLMAASGTAAEAARDAVIHGKDPYLVVIDGAIPLGNPGYGMIAGQSFRDWMGDSADRAVAVIALGTCASFGGIPKANPNPTGAVPVTDVVKKAPVINVSGCPPIPVVISGVLSHYLTFGTIPPLDQHNRPLAFYGETIHDRCYRRPFYDQGKFAKTFDDDGARAGWCLYELGCKGPTTYNACATLKWNGGVSFPIEGGHGCLGCASPDFWDRGSFYQPLAAGTWDHGKALGAAAVAGTALGVGAAIVSRRRQRKLAEGR